MLRAAQSGWVYIPIFVVFLQSRGLSLQEVFLLKSASQLVSAAFEIPTGYFADRFGRRCSILIGGLFSLLAMLMYAWANSFPLFLLAELTLGAGSSFIAGADTALVYDTLSALGEEPRYPKVESNINCVAGFSEALGGIMGGLLASRSLDSPFYLQIFLYLVFLATALGITEPRHSTAVAVGQVSFTAAARRGLASHPAVVELMLWSAVTGTATFVIVWFAQSYMDAIGLPLALFGVTWAAFHCCMAASSLLAFKVERFLGSFHTLLALSAILAFSFSLTAVAWGYAGLVSIMCVYIVRGIRSPLVKNHLNALADSEIRATVLSINNFVFRVMFIFAGPLCGKLASAYSLSAAMQATAGAILLTTIPLVYGLKRKGILH